MNPPLSTHKITVTIDDKVPGCLRSITGPSISVEELDITCHNAESNIRKKMAGLVNLGTVSTTIVYDKTAVSGFYNDLVDGKSHSIEITFNYETPETLTFSAFITSLSIDTSGSDVTASITWTLDGTTAPTWSTA
ncbi:MAG: hypothetical protein E7Z72_00625 [Methanocorpusculum parvum]|nr:hypothetical protein [Methanocorpusculum parvum]